MTNTSLKTTFRFATSEDAKYFYNLLLTEKNKVHRQLAAFGIDNNEFDGTSYKVAIAVMVKGERVGFARLLGGDISGFNYIGLFYIVPAFRRKGIGTQLFNFIENYLINNWNAVGEDLYTIENPPMEKLVKKMGFVLSGVYKKKYSINGKYYSQSRWIKFYK